MQDMVYGPILTVSCGLAMTTNFQLNISHNIRDYLNRISTDYAAAHQIKASAEQRAITYIMIYTVVNTIARWTVGKQVLKNDSV